MLDLDSIRIDGGTQSRVELNEGVVSEYAEIIAGGSQLPAVVVFSDGTTHWLADGFHRYFAHKKLGLTEIAAEVRQGTRRDAVLFSVGANGAHGLRRTNADKRKAVETLLHDAEWVTWSDNHIARACGVSDKTVAAARLSIFGNSEDAKPTKRTVERNGKTYQQNTANVGKVAATSGGEKADSAPQPLVDIKAKAAPQPAPQEPEADEDEGEDLHQMLTDMQRECEGYARRLADWERSMQGDGRDALVTAIKRYEHAEREKALSDERAVQYQRQRDEALNKIKAVGRAIGEPDPDKVVRAVQALARSTKAEA